MTLSTAANRTFAFVPALLSVSVFVLSAVCPTLPGRNFDRRPGALCGSLRHVEGLEYRHTR